jgi:hypothetical protein
LQEPWGYYTGSRVIGLYVRFDEETRMPFTAEEAELEQLVRASLVQPRTRHDLRACSFETAPGAPLGHERRGNLPPASGAGNRSLRLGPRDRQVGPATTTADGRSPHIGQRPRLGHLPLAPAMLRHVLSGNGLQLLSVEP